MSDPGPARVDAALARFGRATSHPVAVRLDEAWLSMTSVLVPTLDIERWRAQLDSLAGGCAERTREGVMEHLFGSQRFRGDTERYGDWRNSRIDRVLADGAGIPITLSIVAIEVARRLGVTLVGVGMPAHFLIGDPTDREWFADPFSGTAGLDRDDCRALFQRVTGGNGPWRDDYLRPTPPAAIVVRMLNNLRAAFTRDGDVIRLGLVMRMRSMLATTDSVDDTRRALAVFN